jgi:hypothetical protein
MGTKDSYSGGGGAAGDALREGVDDWLASLPGGNSGVSPVSEPNADEIPGNRDQSSGAAATSTSARVLPTIALFGSARAGNRSGGRSTTRPTPQLARSKSTSARAAGRGAAAAYAFRTGDAETLRDLGLDYNELQANPNIFDVAHKIAQKVCEDLPPGTIETEEILHVVGDLAEWLVEADPTGPPPPPSQIAQEAVALILAEAYLVETANKLNAKGMPGRERAAFEDSVRQACEELAAQADLSPAGPTAAEFTTAIENGLEYLRSVYEDPTDG